MANEYVFVDEWEVDAPQQAVFEALAAPTRSGGSPSTSR
jgi:hypothetical protein